MNRARFRIRVDDFPGTKPAEFDRHNVHSYLEFHRVLAYEHYINRYVLGVIPFHTTNEHARNIVKYAEDVVVAMHGVIHDESRRGEFDGVDPVTATHTLWLTRTRMGAMFRRDITHYIPPHNVIGGREHAQAIVTAGFRELYGGPETNLDDIAGLPEGSVAYHHSEPPLTYGRSDELLERGSVPHIVSCLESGQDVCLGLHWTWEYNIGLDNLRKFLDELLAGKRHYTVLDAMVWDHTCGFA